LEENLQDENNKEMEGIESHLDNEGNLSIQYSPNLEKYPIRTPPLC
jgi:hypothetical protein